MSTAVAFPVAPAVRRSHLPSGKCSVPKNAIAKHLDVSPQGQSPFGNLSLEGIAFATLGYSSINHCLCFEVNGLSSGALWKVRFQAVENQVLLSSYSQKKKLCGLGFSIVVFKILGSEFSWYCYSFFSLQILSCVLAVQHFKFCLILSGTCH